ncbi:MAG TPA: branched-chain amino acid ABC transporter permease [Methylomirabilota bacterium]|nr:branched-chain amino acid ABC transporter permease [Methylomirabilota bacterium]
MSDYSVSLLIRIGIEAFVALSAYLLLLVGRISFGQQGFFVIGAYAAGMATALWGAPLSVGVLIGALAGAAAGVLFAAPMARARGLYFAAGTLAFGELTRVGLLVFQYRRPIGPDLVGPAGADGFRGIRALFTSGVSVGLYAAAIWVLLAAVVVGLIALLRSRWGEAARMLGDDEDAAAALGVRVARVAAGAVVIAGALAGLGGGLFAHYATYVEPGHADVMLGVHSLAYGFLGGLGTPLGPILGVALDIGLLESFRVLAGYRMIIFGGLVAAFLIARPRGIFDERTIRRFARARAGQT